MPQPPRSRERARVGQETRGKLMGRVTDPSGSTIIDAQVRATDTATGVTSEARSNAAGEYEIP